jgi:hypothetical protein
MHALELGTSVEATGHYRQHEPSSVQAVCKQYASSMQAVCKHCAGTYTLSEAGALLVTPHSVATGLNRGLGSTATLAAR